MANVGIVEDGRASVPRVPQGPGAFATFGALREMRRDPLSYFVRLLHENRDAAGFSIGLDRVLMLNNPRYVRHVLPANHQNYHKSKLYEPLRPLLGDGIFLRGGNNGSASGELRCLHSADLSSAKWRAK